MRFDATYSAKIGLLAAISMILMIFEVPVPLMPVFLKLDISELPAVIAAFSLGPLAAVLVSLLKNLLHAFNSQTAGIGEMANFLVGSAFLLPAALGYRRRPTFNGAALALLGGTVSMVLVAAALNYFVFLPLYQAVLHFPLDKMIALGTAANRHIIDLQTFIVLAIAPFNIVKGLVITLCTLLIYKKIIPLLHS